MIRMSIILAVLTATPALAESYVGTWSSGSSVGLPRCSTDDDNKIVLRSSSESGYEHFCKFTQKRQIDEYVAHNSFLHG